MASSVGFIQISLNSYPLSNSQLLNTRADGRAKHWWMHIGIAIRMITVPNGNSQMEQLQLRESMMRNVGFELLSTRRVINKVNWPLSRYKIRYSLLLKLSLLWKCRFRHGASEKMFLNVYQNFKITQIKKEKKLAGERRAEAKRVNGRERRPTLLS